MNLESKIEAILFFKGEPLSFKKLADILKVSPSEVREAIANLKNILADRGVILLETSEKVTLGTAPEMGKIIEDLQKEELNKELSRASLETLSIVLYKNGASRGEIDYIRGVNSSFILRALSVRGLLDKIPDSRDNRRIIYKPSLNLLSFMGLRSVKELPAYGEINTSVETTAQDLESLSDSREE